MQLDMLRDQGRQQYLKFSNAALELAKKIKIFQNRMSEACYLGLYCIEKIHVNPKIWSEILSDGIPMYDNNLLEPRFLGIKIEVDNGIDEKEGARFEIKILG